MAGRLRNIISGIFHSFTDKKGGDWQIIFACIAVAAIIWLATALSKDYTTTISYPLVFRYDSTSLVRVEPLPNSIIMNVQSKGWQLTRLSSIFNPSPVVVEVESVPMRNYITSSDLLTMVLQQLPFLTPNYISTDSILVHLDSLSERRVALAIDAKTINVAKNHCIIGPVVLEPDSITLKGPMGLLDTIQEPVYITYEANEIKEDVKEMITLNSSRFKRIQTGNPSIEVRFLVSNGKKRQFVVPIKLKNFPDEPRFSKTVYTEISIGLSAEHFNIVHPDSFRFSANYFQLNPADSTVPVTPESYPPDVEKLFIFKQKLYVGNKKD